MNNFIFVFLMLTFQIFNFLYRSTILQSQYYDLKRLFLFDLQNKTLSIIKIILIISSFAVIRINIYFIFLAFLTFIHKNKNMKIILTKRMVRMLTVFIILFLININLIFYSDINNSYFCYILLIYNLIHYYVSFFVSTTIEKIIQRKYIKLAQNKLRKYKPIIVGITGSYGKTSCKIFTYKLLEKKYNVLCSPESYNTVMGLTKTINNYLKPYHQILILEVGVDKKNGMNKFFKYYNFDVGVVTCIGNQHLKTFKSLQNIINEKKKLLEKAKYHAIFRKDDFIESQILNKNQTCFSSEINADICVIKKENNNVAVKIYKDYFNTTSNLIGDHSFSNLACAISIAKYFNIETIDICKTIPYIKNVDHRLSIIKTGNWTIIDDAYNSNFEGFKNALKLLSESKEKKVLITPGVIEQNKKSLVDEINISKFINNNVDLVILIKKPKIKKYITNYLEFNNFNDALNYLKKTYPNDKLTILIENDLPNIYLR